MDNPISNKLRRLHKQIEHYSMEEFPVMAGKKTLAFIDNRFRSQNWEGTPWPARKDRRNTRPLLIKTAALRRSFRMLINQTKGTTPRSSAKIYTNLKYARPHNEGFEGTVTVPAHYRRTYGKYKVSSLKSKKTRKIKTLSGRVLVKEHTRRMVIPKRQFMPRTQTDSVTLANSIRTQARNDIFAILNS